MAGRTGTGINKHQINGWPEGHSYKHIQYTAGQRDAVSNIPVPLAVALLGFVIVREKKGGDGGQAHVEGLNGLPLYGWH